jgi:rhamnose utilization protein RhaD (predicted bifunctional aldolase and dehydrogenase)
MGIKELAELSRLYGGDPDKVIAGGGNTSFKDGETLAVKGSGMSLAEIREEDFVLMDRRALGGIFAKSYPREPEAREAAALADLMAARKPGEEKKRPSVETLVHEVLPFPYVVHTHPALVNGLTCSLGGEGAAAEVFGGEALWIPITNPGYVLARLVREGREEFSRRRGRPPELILLQNHGIFASGESPGAVQELYRRVMGTLSARIKRRPGETPPPRPPEAGEIEQKLAALGSAAGGAGGAGGSGGEPWRAAFLPHPEAPALTRSREAFYPVSSAFTPDHIVYAGSEALFVEDPAALEQSWGEFRRRAGRIPRITAVRGIGIFGAGPSEKALAGSLALFADAIKVAVYAESFGGPRFMDREHIDFINNWEVERYRSKISGGAV